MCYYVRCVPCSHKTGIYDKKVDFLDLTLYKIYLLLPTCIGQKSRCSPKCKKIFFFLIRQIFNRVLKKYLHIADWNVRNGYLVRGELWYGLPPPLHPICMTRLLESLALAKLVSFTQFHFFTPFYWDNFRVCRDQKSSQIELQGDNDSWYRRIQVFQLSLQSGIQPKAVGWRSWCYHHR